jgi:hypothetical protein
MTEHSPVSAVSDMTSRLLGEASQCREGNAAIGGI